jgi:hypothetical protein
LLLLDKSILSFFKGIERLSGAAISLANHYTTVARVLQPLSAFFFAFFLLFFFQYSTRFFSWKCKNSRFFGKKTISSPTV